jgi:hypothetical protein
MRFVLIQKIEQKLPLKNTPSTIENARSLNGNGAMDESIHLNIQSAFFLITGIVCIALNKAYFSASFLMKTSINNEYVSE